MPRRLGSVTSSTEHHNEDDKTIPFGSFWPSNSVRSSQILPLWRPLETDTERRDADQGIRLRVMETSSSSFGRTHIPIGTNGSHARIRAMHTFSRATRMTYRSVVRRSMPPTMGPTRSAPTGPVAQPRIPRPQPADRDARGYRSTARWRRPAYGGRWTRTRSIGYSRRRYGPFCTRTSPSRNVIRIE